MTFFSERMLSYTLNFLYVMHRPGSVFMEVN